MTNPFSNWIVGDPWDSEEGDVSEIGRKAFQTCLEAIETTAQRHKSTSVLLYGEPGSGKTHLIRRLRTHLALRRSEKCPRTIFIYIRMETSATMIWRHIRRRLVEDLLRPASSDSTQLYGLLMQRLAMPGSRGALLDEWKREISDGAPLNREAFAEVLEIILNHIPPDDLQTLEIFDQLDGEQDLPWELRQALRHVTHRRHETLTRAWLRGDSLAEADLGRIGISTREDDAGDVEDRAKLVVVALAKFVGPGTPIVLCLDQLEALETPPGDLSGFAALGRAVSTLHDGTVNVVLLSCIQSSYRQSLENAGKANFARIAEFEGLLPLLGREEAARLLQSRRAFAANPAMGRGEGPLWPFQEVGPRRSLRSIGPRQRSQNLEQGVRKIWPGPRFGFGIPRVRVAPAHGRGVACGGQRCRSNPGRWDQVAGEFERQTLVNQSDVGRHQLLRAEPVRRYCGQSCATTKM